MVVVVVVPSCRGCTHGRSVAASGTPLLVGVSVRVPSSSTGGARSSSWARRVASFGSSQCENKLRCGGPTQQHNYLLVFLVQHVRLRLAVLIDEVGDEESKPNLDPLQDVP